MSHSGVPIVSQVAQLVSGAERDSNQAPTPIAPPAAPSLSSSAVTAAGNTETESEGQGIAANILTKPAVDEEPETASSMLLGS